MTGKRLFLVLGFLLLVKVLVIAVVLGRAQAAGAVPPGGDRRDLYYDIAQTLASGHGYRVTADTAETMVRNPGYVGLLAGLIWAFGDAQWPVQAVNVLCALGSVVLAGLLARRLTRHDLPAVVAMLITGLYPLGLALESRAGVESLFTFLLMFSVWLLYRVGEEQRYPALVIAGMAIGAATLVRSSALFLLPFVMIWLMLRASQARRRQAALHAAVIALAAVTFVSPWIVRNWQLSGRPTFSESHVGIGAWQGWYATATMGDAKPYQWRIEDGRQLQPAIAMAAGAKFRPVLPPSDARWDIYPTIQDELLYSDALMDATLARFRADPLLLVRHLAVNTVRFWFQGAHERLTAIITVVNAPLLGLAIAGIVVAWRRRTDVIPLVIPIVVLWGIHVPLIAHARYATPLAPLLAVLVAIAIDAWRSPGSSSAAAAARSG